MRPLIPDVLERRAHAIALREARPISNVISLAIKLGLERLEKGDYGTKPKADSVADTLRFLGGMRKRAGEIVKEMNSHIEQTSRDPSLNSLTEYLIAHRDNVARLVTETDPPFHEIAEVMRG